MKKITLIFFTFSGIYTGSAQTTATSGDTAAAALQRKLTTQPFNREIMLQQKPAVQVIPNPAKNKVELQVTGFDMGYLEVTLLNNAGKPIKQEKRLLVQGNETVILMFSQPPGLYYLQLRQGARMVRTKLVIQ